MKQLVKMQQIAFNRFTQSMVPLSHLGLYKRVASSARNQQMTALTRGLRTEHYQYILSQF